MNIFSMTGLIGTRLQIRSYLAFLLLQTIILIYLLRSGDCCVVKKEKILRLLRIAANRLED